MLLLTGPTAAGKTPLAAYTGKALAGLIQHIHSGRFRHDQAVIFLHTGGEPALFAGTGAWMAGG